MIYHLSQLEGYGLLTIIKIIDSPYLSSLIAEKSGGYLAANAVFFYKT
jgi:hypothetical protein